MRAPPLCHGMAESPVVSRAMIHHRPKGMGGWVGKKDNPKYVGETPNEGGLTLWNKVVWNEYMSPQIAYAGNNLS